MRESSKNLIVIGLLLIVALMGTAVAVTADEDGTFVIGIGSEPRTTDQQQSIDLFPPYVNYVCYDTLLRYIGDNPVPQPWLATSYSVSEDGITYTFNLREGVQFIDGTPFNADAVVFLSLIHI